MTKKEQQTELSRDDYKTISTLQDSKKTEKIWIVKVQDFSAQEDISLQIDLPGYSTSFTFNSAHYQTSNQEFIEPRIITRWNGKMSNQEGTGDFILFRDNFNAYGGIIQINGDAYELLPIKANISALRKLNNNYFSSGTCETSGEGTAMSNGGSPLCTPIECEPVIVRLLVLAPPDYIQYLAEEANENLFIMTFIHAFITQSFAIALDNSELDFVTVEIISKKYNFEYHSTNPDEALSSIDIANLASFSPELNLANNTSKTILLTNVDYFGIRGRAECVALNDAECVNAIVEASSGLIPTWSFAHEAGHLFGATHDWPHDDPFNFDFCGHAKQFRFTGDEDRTVTAVLADVEIENDNSKRLLYFSNPDLTYEDDGTIYQLGQNPNENNYIVLKNVFCGTEGFQEDNFTESRSMTSNPRIDSKLETFPNPMLNELSIKNSINIYSIEIYDIKGETIYSNSEINQLEWQVNTSNFRSGLYFVKITTANNVHSKKILKK